MGSPRDSSPGQLPQDVYDTVLPWWRSRIRSVIRNAVECESPYLAEMQVSHTFRPSWHPYRLHPDSSVISGILGWTYILCTCLRSERIISS